MVQTKRSVPPTFPTTITMGRLLSSHARSEPDPASNVRSQLLRVRNWKDLSSHRLALQGADNSARCGRVGSPQSLRGSRPKVAIISHHHARPRESEKESGWWKKEGWHPLVCTSGHQTSKRGVNVRQGLHNRGCHSQQRCEKQRKHIKN